MCAAEIKVRMKSITKTYVHRVPTLLTAFGEKELGKNWFACNDILPNINKALNAPMLICHRQGTSNLWKDIFFRKYEEASQ